MRTLLILRTCFCNSFLCCFRGADIEDITWPRGMRILSSSGESICQHEKIKFVSPSGHGMFCLFYRYWWNSYIKHNFFFRQIFLNVLQARKSIDLNIWQLMEKVTGNCTVFARQAQKGEGVGRERKARKRRKGKGAPALRAGVFVFRPPFSELIRQYVTNHK